MPALAAASGRVQEHHGLNGVHVRPDERFRDVQHAGMQHAAFGCRIEAGKHVDARRRFEFFLQGIVDFRLGRFRFLAVQPRALCQLVQLGDVFFF